MTIIFKEDWEKNGGFPDFNTSNVTAIRMATTLKRMGIDNHTFLLALYDQDLVGVDPFDPNLSLELQAKVTREFATNLWYALRECIRIPPVVGLEDVPFRFHRANVALMWMFLNRVFHIAVISRQRGKTQATVALLLWLLNTRTNLTISSITKDDDLRGSTIRMFKKTYDALPKYLQFRTGADSRNQQEFTVNILRNIFKMAVPSQSAKRAYMIGRGLTSTTTWSDESCFSPNIRISLGACIASGTYAREEAILKGEPSGIILTTTAGRIDDPDAGYVYELCESSTPFNELLYDSRDVDDLQSIIRNNNPAHLSRVYSVFNHRQLGVTDEQQLEAMQMSAQSKMDAERDFLSIWNRGNVGHPLPEPILKAINQNVWEPVHCALHRPENNIVNWYVDKDTVSELTHHPIVVSVDPSEGIGIDAMALCACSCVTGEVLCTAEQSITAIPVYGRWLYTTFIKPYTATVLVIENRSSGQAIIDILIELMIADGINPFLRLFNTIVQDKELYKDQWESVRPPKFRPADNRHIHYKKHFGFKTSGSGQFARSMLYGEIFYTSCSTHGTAMRDRRLINQVNALIEKDDKITHPPGGHDDLVIAWLLCHWFLQRARNTDTYGIASRYILSTSVVKEVQTQEELAVEEAKYKYQQLLEELRDTNNNFAQKRIVHQLRNIELMIPEVMDNTGSTLSQIVQELKDRKTVDRVITRFGGNGTPDAVTFSQHYVGR